MYMISVIIVGLFVILVVYAMCRVIIDKGVYCQHGKEWMSDCAECQCPFDEPLHNHHDGCPACFMEERQNQLMEDDYGDW